MKIEVKSLKIAASLSEETVAYTADIYIDGRLSFRASNHGHGGCDCFYPVAGATVTEREVSDWLADNVAPMGPFEADPAKRAAYDTGTACDLELYVGRITAAAEAEREETRIRKSFARMLKDKIGAIRPDGAFVTFKALPIAANIESIKKAKPDFIILNYSDQATLAKGLKAYCPNFGEASVAEDHAEAVYERQRTNALTAADARFLMAQDRKAGKPDPELQAHLSALITTSNARENAYREERDNARATATA